MELIRIDSNNGTIYFMEPVNLEHKLTARSLENVKVELVPFCCRCELGTGKLCKGVKVETVKDEAGQVEKKDHGEYGEQGREREESHIDIDGELCLCVYNFVQNFGSSTGTGESLNKDS